MVTLIHDDLPVLGDEVFHSSLSWVLWMMATSTCHHVVLSFRPQFVLLNSPGD